MSIYYLVSKQSKVKLNMNGESTDNENSVLYFKSVETSVIIYTTFLRFKPV